MNSALTKKRVFDGKIYLEGIRQLKMVGITATVILTVLSILPPLTSLIDILSYSADKPSVRQASTDNYLLILAYCVVAPLLALVMFRYLNHRNASDFYHALPAPRVCQFMSFFAAALTWVMAAIIISNGVTLIFWVFLSKYFFINLASSLVFMLGIMAASFLVLASVALAMTVTGTGFTNVIVSLLLIFMPRFVTTAFTSAAATSLWIVDNMSLFPLLDGRYNIVTGSVFGSVRFLFRSENPFQYWPGILYTFVLGLIYTAAAVFLYIRRRSESAEKSAPNYFLQSVYRITLAMFLCVFACGGIVSGMLDGYGFSNASYIVLYTLAVLIYFTYELFTTRRIKSLARAVPGLAVLAAINLVFIFGAVGINNALLNDVPALENIGAIRLLPGDPDDYLQNKVQGYKITDPESIEIAHSALEKAVSSIKRDRENRFRGYYYGDPAYDNDKNVYVQLAFETRVRSMNRNVRMSNADLNKIYAALGQEESFRALYTDLPDPDRNTRVDIAGIQNTDMVKQIYEQLRAEAKEIDFADWAGLVSWSSRNEFRKYIDEYYDILPAVYIFTNVGLDSYQIQVSLGELLPKTTGMVINYKNPYTLSVMHDKVTAYRPSEYDMPFMIFPLNLGSGFTGYPVYMSPTLSQCDWIAEMIAMSFDRDIDISKPCMVIKYENTVAYFQVPDEYLAMVKKWYN